LIASSKKNAASVQFFNDLRGACLAESRDVESPDIFAVGLFDGRFKFFFRNGRFQARQYFFLFFFNFVQDHCENPSVNHSNPIYSFTRNQDEISAFFIGIHEKRRKIHVIRRDKTKFDSVEDPFLREPVASGRANGVKSTWKTPYRFKRERISRTGSSGTAADNAEKPYLCPAPAARGRL
jgi:hypothetical protein